MFEFKDLQSLSIEDLFKELGFADFTYIETSTFLEQLEIYRKHVHERIKEKQHEPSQSLDSSKRPKQN